MSGRIEVTSRVAMLVLTVFAGACSFPSSNESGGASDDTRPPPSERTDDPHGDGTGWTVSFGDSMADRVMATARAPGGFYASGLALLAAPSSPPFGVPAQWRQEEGGTRTFVARFDARGEVAWGHMFPFENGAAIAASGGPVYVLGNVVSGIGRDAKAEARIYKLAPDGALAWSISLGQVTSTDGARAIAPAPNDEGFFLLSTRGDAVVLSKRDSGGGEQWSVARPAAASSALAADERGGVALLLDQATPNADDPGATDLAGLTGQDSRCVSLERFDARGATAFRRFFALHPSGEGLTGRGNSLGANDAMGGPAIAFVEDDIALVSHLPLGTIDMAPGGASETHVGGQGHEYVIARYDGAQGELRWSRSYDGPVNPDWRTLNGVTGDANGNVYVTGAYAGKLALDPASDGDVRLAKKTDGFVARFDRDGGYTGARTWGGASDDWVSSPLVLDDGHLLVAGVFRESVDFGTKTASRIHESRGHGDGFFSSTPLAAFTTAVE